MKRLFRAIRCSSVKKQFLVFIVSLFLTLVIFCVILIHSAGQALLNESLQYVEKSRKDFQSAVSSLTKQANSTFTQLQYESACKTMLSASSYQQIFPGVINEINTVLASIKISNTSIADVAFVSDLLKWSKLYLPDQLVEIQSSMPDQRSMASLGIWYPTSPNRKNAYLVFGYHYYSGKERLGTLIISIDVHSGAAQLPVPQVPGSFLILTDQKGSVCTFGDSENLSDETVEKFKGLFEPGGSSLTTQTVPRDGYIIEATALPQIDSMLLSAVDSRKSQLTLDSFYAVSGIFLAVFCALLILGGMLLYKSVVFPLNKFSGTIAFVREKRLRKLEKPLALNGCAEIRALGEDFSDLLFSINSLTGEILQQASALYEAEVLRKNAELDVLRSQINPHFLYNTLELIRAAAIRGDAGKVSLITSAIGKIYRYTAKGEPFVPLSQEMDIVKAYVNIQQARFQNRITTLYSVSKEAARVPVFKMLLQPLVENAFVHGLEPKPDNGVLYVGAKTEEGLLWITIRDNGVGIAPERLEELERQLAAKVIDTSSHLGLVNIDARLKLQYGEDYGLGISSAPGDGTCVTIRLPIPEDEPQKGDA